MGSCSDEQSHLYLEENRCDDGVNLYKLTEALDISESRALNILNSEHW